MRICQFQALAMGIAAIAAGCATAGDAPTEPSGSADARPSADARRPSDAAPGAPDAPPGTPDAPPSPPDATPPPPDATPPPPDAMAGVCVAQGPLTCGIAQTGSLLSAANSVSGHSCSALDTTGADAIYSFVAPASGSVTATLNVIDDDPLFGDDFDLYVLTGVCDPLACLTHGQATGDESVTFSVVAGQTYFLVAEAFAFGLLTSGDYALSVCWP